MKISMRTAKGWSEKVENRSDTNCDRCGAKLFQAPHGGIYCDAIHTPTIKESAAAIRTALRSRYGTKGQRGTSKVSVTLGTGTARAWIHINVEIPGTEFLNTNRDRENATREEIRKIIIGMKERKEIGLASYYSDDGIGEASDCLLIQVNAR